MRYVIITPARNESDYIERTIKSVLSQKLCPEEWVIVDDGSTDYTQEIIKRYSEEYKWINLVKMDTRNETRLGGAKVVRAFNYGLKSLNTSDYDFLTKLDADLELPSEYFLKISEEFQKIPKLGLCGGYCVNIKNNIQIREKSANYHIRGAFKSYRKDCFEDIGGLMEVWAWDGIDELTALYKGWQTKTLEIPVLHFRPTSSAYSPLKQEYLSGKEAYRIRSSFLLTLGRSVYKLKLKPYILASLFFLWGYITGYFVREVRYVDVKLGKFINNFHTKRILFSLKTKIFPFLSI